MASIEDILEDESYELDEGCSKHRSNLAISSHGLANGNCCVECKFGMLFVCSFGDQKDTNLGVCHIQVVSIWVPFMNAMRLGARLVSDLGFPYFYRPNLRKKNKN